MLLNAVKDQTTQMNHKLSITINSIFPYHGVSKINQIMSRLNNHLRLKMNRI